MYYVHIIPTVTLLYYFCKDISVKQSANVFHLNRAANLGISDTVFTCPKYQHKNSLYAMHSALDHTVNRPRRYKVKYDTQCDKVASPEGR
jgi:hypothetical protein